MTARTTTGPRSCLASLTPAFYQGRDAALPQARAGETLSERARAAAVFEQAQAYVYGAQPNDRLGQRHHNDG